MGQEPDINGLEISSRAVFFQRLLGDLNTTLTQVLEMLVFGCGQAEITCYDLILTRDRAQDAASH